MKLELPDGIGVGNVATFVYHDEGSSDIVIEPGKWEGRILSINGSRITVHFVYGPGYDPPLETIVINLETGMDEKYGVPVSDIEVPQR
jgi:hypothetical protein